MTVVRLTAIADGIPRMLECCHVMSSRTFTLQSAIFLCVRAEIVLWMQVEELQLLKFHLHVLTQLKLFSG